MGKIVSNFFISLDGVVEAPHEWHFPYFNDEMGEVIGAGMETAAGFLMGRKLYGEWAEYWPTSTDEPFATFINQVPKYVVSNTLTSAEWNNTSVVTGDVAAELQRLKDETEGNLVISGSATLVRSLISLGLLDELQLLLHPIAVGHGQRLFEDVSTIPLKLESSKPLDTGVLHLVYLPA